MSRLFINDVALKTNEVDMLFQLSDNKYLYTKIGDVSMWLYYDHNSRLNLSRNKKTKFTLSETEKSSLKFNDMYLVPIFEPVIPIWFILLAIIICILLCIIACYLGYYEGYNSMLKYMPEFTNS